MKIHNNFNSLHIFSVCARVLNFRKAADQLHLTQSAVAQRVRQLEAQLGVKLFERRARGLQLTPVGETYAAELAQGFSIIQKATDALGAKDTDITLTTTPSFAAKWLIPRLAGFKEMFPDYNLHIEAQNEKSTLGPGAADCAIRLGSPPFNPNLAHELLWSPTLCLAAPAGFSENNLKCSNVSLLVDTHCRWEDYLTDADLTDLKRIKVSQSSLAIDAVIAGQGLTVTPLEFIEKHLENSELTMIKQFDASRLSEKQLGFYFLVPRDAREQHKYQVIHEWLFGDDT